MSDGSLVGPTGAASGVETSVTSPGLGARSPDGSPSSTVGSVDVTEEVLRRQESERANQQIKAVLEEMPVGVALGLTIAYTAAAIMRARTEAPVHAAITLQTILFAAAASITIGIAFGLYPALRAARLSPIDAIRHE